MHVHLIHISGDIVMGDFGNIGSSKLSGSIGGDLAKIFPSDWHDKQSDKKQDTRNPNSRGWSRNAKIPSLASYALLMSKCPLSAFLMGEY
nr:hypothetical protein [Tanacetum cinerariifolium]